MKYNKIPVKDIAEKLGKKAKAVSEDIKVKIHVYADFLSTLACIGKNISLDPDEGLIKVKEAFVNDYLKEVSAVDKGLRSVKLMCREKHTAFIIELKKFLLDGIIEIPFTVNNFIFNKGKKTISLKLIDKKVARGNNYHSKIVLCLVLSILNIFKKNEMLKNKTFFHDSIQLSHDGNYIIELNKIPELKELFEKDMANIKYRDLIAIYNLSFEKGFMICRLLRKPAEIIKLSIGLAKILAAGRLIRSLVNRS